MLVNNTFTAFYVCSFALIFFSAPNASLSFCYPLLLLLHRSFLFWLEVALTVDSQWDAGAQLEFIHVCHVSLLIHHAARNAYFHH